MSLPSALPVTVLTGFLGSGKTTLLRQVLEAKGGERVAVLINEFGEVGIDHLLVKNVADSTVLLQNGCVCCAVRSDLRSALRDLLDGHSRGEIPPFDRIVIETTGLADPVPVVQTLVIDPMLRNRLRLSGLVSTVDAMNGAEQIATQEEAARQVATADRLIVTKTDLCEDERVDRLERILSRINPTASVLRGPVSGDVWGIVLADDRDGAMERSWFGATQDLAASQFVSEAVTPRRESIRSFVFRADKAIDWAAFAVWLSLMVHRHGRQILRVKGILYAPGDGSPISFNTVQNFIHPPVHLDNWPDDDHSSRLVPSSKVSTRPPSDARSSGFSGWPTG